MKKQSLPKQVLNKLTKAQYKPDAYVIITWLGEHFYGYVKRTETIGGKLAYWVETLNGAYPVGIIFKGNKSSKWGWIHWQSTKDVGSDEIKKRFGRREKPTTTTISKQQRTRSRKVGSDANDVTSVSGDNSSAIHTPDKTSSKPKRGRPRQGTGGKDVDAPKSNTRNRKVRKG